MITRQHRSANYWACDNLGEINLHQQCNRPSGFKLTHHRNALENSN